MTNLGLPPQGANLSAGAAANALVGDRSAGKQRDGLDGSVFVALLDDVNAPAKPTTGNASPGGQPAIPSTGEPGASPASISAIHSLGSGVLVALDKRFGVATTETGDPGAPEAPETGPNGNVDMSALTSLGWAALIMSATGAAPLSAAAAPAASTSQGAQAKTGAIGAASAALVARTEKGAASTAQVGRGAIDGDAETQVQLPSDAALKSSLQPIALNAGTAPVDVKVVRSITYLGLDPTVRDGGQASAGAAPRSSATSSAAGAAPGGLEDNGALAPLANAAGGGGSSAMSGDEQSRQRMQNAAKSQHASESAAAVKEPVAGADVTGAAAGVTQTSLGAISASAFPAVQVSQLADVIANAAQNMGAQDGDGAVSVRTANGTSLASMAPVKELDVQLNPASLGALSIEMRLSNGNLSVTIKADKADTLKLIENERSAISEKLKSLNFSVESLNVKALDATAPNSASGEASNSGTTGYGEAQQGHQGQTADGSPNNGRSLQGGGEQGKPRPQARGVLGESGDDRSNLGHRFV